MSALTLANNHGHSNEIAPIADDIEQSKTMIIYYTVMFKMSLRHNQINYGELWENTFMNIVWNMIRCFAQWLKQHWLVT